MYKEVDFCGIYLAPFFVCLIIAGIIYVPLHRFWDHIALQRRVWNRPLFEMGLFIILLALVTFIL